MAVMTIDVSDSAGVNVATISNAPLVGTEYGLAVRNIESSANSSFAALRVAITLLEPGAGPAQITSSTPAADRRTARIKNDSAYTVFLGGGHAVTTTNGFALLPGEVEIFEIGSNLSIWGIVSSTSVSGYLYVLELG
jgi:hypothetical protein